MTRATSPPVLCHVLYGFGMGGAERQLAQVINATAGEFRHCIASLNGDTAARAHLDDADAVRFADVPPGRGRHLYFLRLAAWLRRERPDLVLSYGWAGVDAILAARLAGIRRVVHAEHGFHGPELAHQLRRRRWMRRAFFRMVRTLVVPSEKMHRVARCNWWIPEDQIRVLYSSVDTARFPRVTDAERRAAKAQLGIAPDTIVIGTVGRLAPPKNLTLLLESFAAVRSPHPLHLLIVGDGAEWARLESRARELCIDDRTTFTGQLDDTLACYRCIDVFAMSSVTEQRPLALLEATSCGLPAVVTDAGDCPAMLAPAGRDLVVPRGDGDELARRLAEMAGDESRRRTIGEANASFCRERFDSAGTVAAYRELYLAALRS